MVTPRKPPVEPWHRQKGESPREYECFNLFLISPPKQRTSKFVANSFGLTEQLITRTRTKWKWNERVLEYDRWLSREADKIAAQAVHETMFNWADWEWQNHEKVRAITERLLTRTEQMLNLPVQELVKKDPVFHPETGDQLMDAEGKPLFATTIVKPMRFTAGDVPRYAEAALILTRYLAEQNGLRPIVPAIPAPHKPIDEMTIEERGEYIANLRARQQAIVSGQTVQDETGGQPQ